MGRSTLVFAGLALALAACGRDPAPGPATLEERGMAEFRACAVCHARTDPAVPGTPRLIGPSLYKVVGAPSAHVPDYGYSPAMRRAGLVWDEATLDAFIAAPQSVISGTRMSYGGEPDPQKRAALIAYLKTLR